MVDLTGVEGAGQGQGAAGDSSGGLVHAGEGRIVVGAQATSRVSQGGVL